MPVGNNRVRLLTFAIMACVGSAPSSDGSQPPSSQPRVSSFNQGWLFHRGGEDTTQLSCRFQPGFEGCASVRKIPDPSVFVPHNGTRLCVRAAPPLL